MLVISLCLCEAFLIWLYHYKWLVLNEMILFHWFNRNIITSFKLLTLNFWHLLSSGLWRFLKCGHVRGVATRCGIWIVTDLTQHAFLLYISLMKSKRLPKNRSPSLFCIWCSIHALSLKSSHFSKDYNQMLFLSVWTWAILDWSAWLVSEENGASHEFVQVCVRHVA